jgi:hypothetical protein
MNFHKKLPTDTIEMGVLGNARTLADIQRPAASGSAANDGISPLEAPITRDILLPAIARIKLASTPYNLT